MSRVSLSRRLARLRDVLIPPDSIEARVEKLPERERAIISRLKNHWSLMHQWCADRSLNAYGYFLDNPGDWGRLPPSIERLLFAEEPYQ